MNPSIQFQMPNHRNNIIKVIGVGGGGGNAVNHMFRQGIKDVDFVICNTDAQALNASFIPTKVFLGQNLTEGLGAGSNPEVGRMAAEESMNDIIDCFGEGTKMCFITAGMGGGTGTGAAPVIARIAKELGILTVGIVTTPYFREGRKKRMVAEEGIREMRKYTDCVLMVNNDKLPMMYGNLTLSQAFAKADDILSTAAKGISEIITVSGRLNVDFADVKNALKDSDTAIMGMGMATGQNRAVEAVRMALESPLLNDNNVKGAKRVLVNITYGQRELLVEEFDQIMAYIEDEVGIDADIKIGDCFSENMDDEVNVTLIITGFESQHALGANQKITVAEIDTKPNTEPVAESKPTLEASIVSKEPNAFISNEQFTMEIISVPSEKIESPEISSEIDESPKIKNWDIPFSVNQPAEVESEIFSDTIEEENITDSKIVYNLNDQDIIEVSSNTVPVVEPVQSNLDQMISDEELKRRSDDRTRQLRKLSETVKSDSGLQETLSVPAFMRNKVTLNNTLHSSERSSSNFSLYEDELDNRPAIRSNNQFFDTKAD